ncbi:MAG TPA: hypothetical protein VFD60_08225, partial [Nitrososphaeraceae archaeon]|nr:hypothetical protein [Nitrososphaeraceae archaeon]
MTDTYGSSKFEDFSVHLCNMLIRTPKDGIGPFIELYRLIEAAGMDLKHVKRLLEIANNELPKVEQMHKNLHADVMDLNQKRR